MGLFQGNTLDFGFYDDCLAITHETNDDVIHARYCYAGLAVPVDLSFTEEFTRRKEFMVSDG